MKPQQQETHSSRKCRRFPKKFMLNAHMNANAATAELIISLASAQRTAMLVTHAGPYATGRSVAEKNGCKVNRHINRAIAALEDVLTLPEIQTRETHPRKQDRVGKQRCPLTYEQ